MSTELYKRFRPKTLRGVVGNESTKKALENMLIQNTVPHTILFHGPSGCGKTTLARILMSELFCHDIDFQELNCADFRGIDTSRDIRSTMHLSPVGGKCKIYLLDEFHQATKQLQNAMLKLLEDTPNHVYFFLCTTDPQKLLKTIRTRCCEMPVELLSELNTKRLLTRVIKKTKLTIDSDVIEDIVDASQGSARKALVILDKIINISPEDRSEAIASQDEKKEGFDLCKALINNKNGWTTIAKILKNINGEPEGIRYNVLGYCNAILMKKTDRRIFHIMTCFEKNYYDTKKFGLTMSCYEAIHGEF